MRQIRYTKSFKDDMKRIKKYPAYDADKLEELVSLIAEGEQLDAKYTDHKMVRQSRAEYIGSREFHLASDICVVYRIQDETVYLQRIGKHNQLRLTSSLR